MKILILEIKGSKANILCEDGSFRTVHAESGWQNGMSLDYEPQKQLKTDEVKNGRLITLPRVLKTLAAAAACLVLCFGIYSYYTAANTVSSFVEVGINPAVRLLVNKNGKVISAEGINSDGEKLLSKLPDSRKLSSRISDIISEAANEGYFENEEKYVSIVVADDNTANAEKTENELLAAAAQTLRENNIQPVVRTRKTTVTQADKVRGDVEKGIASGMTLTDAYELSLWNTDLPSLWIEEIEYKRDGKFEIEFSQNLICTDKSQVTVISQQGERTACRVYAEDDDEWVAEAQGLTEGEIYRLEIIADKAGQSVTLTGAFLAGRRQNTVSPHSGLKTVPAYVFDGGVMLKAWDIVNYSVTDKTSARIKTADGNIYTAEKVLKEGEMWLLYTDKIKAGDTFTAEITDIASGGKTGLFRAVCHAQEARNDEIHVKEAELDCDDGEIEIEFSRRVAWGAAPILTLKDTDGNTVAFSDFKYNSHEIKAKTARVSPGTEYTFTLTDPTGSVKPFEGILIAED